MNNQNNKSISHSNDEVSGFMLLKILYKGKLTILITGIILSTFSLIYFIYLNNNQQFLKEIDIKEISFDSDSYKPLRDINVKIENLSLKILNNSRDKPKFEKQYVELLNLNPAKYFNDFLKQINLKILKEDELQKLNSYEFNDYEGVIYFKFFSKNINDLNDITNALITKTLDHQVNYIKQKTYFTFLYLDKFISNIYDLENKILYENKFIIEAYKNTFLENFERHSLQDQTDLLVKLNDIIINSFIALDHKSGLPQNIKELALKNSFNNLLELEKKYEFFINININDLQKIKNLKSIQLDLNQLKNDVNQLKNSSLLNIIEKDVVRTNQNNLIYVFIFSLFIGFSIGLIIVLFRHSIEKE